MHLISLQILKMNYRFSLYKSINLILRINWIRLDIKLKKNNNNNKNIFYAPANISIVVVTAACYWVSFFRVLHLLLLLAVISVITVFICCCYKLINQYYFFDFFLVPCKWTSSLLFDICYVLLVRNGARRIRRSKRADLSSSIKIRFLLLFSYASETTESVDANVGLKSCSLMCSNKIQISIG